MRSLSGLSFALPKHSHSFGQCCKSDLSGTKPLYDILIHRSAQRNIYSCTLNGCSEGGSVLSTENLCKNGV